MKIQISGKTYDVKFTSVKGGHFDTGKKIIEIAKGADEENTIEAFVHECAEVILTERKYRYENRVS